MAMLQSDFDVARQDAARTEQQLRSEAKRTEARLREDAQSLERRLQERVDELHAELAQSKQTAGDLQSVIVDVEKQNAALETEAHRLTAAAEFAEGEAAGLQLASQQQAEALSAAREQLAALASEAELTGMSLQEARQQLARAQGEADTGRGQLRQLVAEQASARRERQRLESEMARLQKEGVATADALSKALADAERLRELTDIFKRCEADRMRESEQRLAAQQHQHNQQMGVLQQQIVGLEGQLAVAAQRCSDQDVELATVHKQAGLLAVRLRDANRTTATAEKARTAAQAAARDYAAHAQVATE
ncbi:hypothetical protein MNEG_0732 [Monoraphidium neglectum]|uniref:Uncharacterized protein n=1 Tax=Monoraphidium neglectum TaxID=145388 RepID=A0A0D2LLJ4_9CHLO|nr:hypothetical protein MNEG_0732 [Monoraphidium neglectum]KIZ07219.1 hypothetical protein MNEG_0732 [Monoraphidium neglectum]|eukprot:XP_013906238.1 hypothetical protein MNEG_0732 [Monoraphidium neglectum]